MLTYQRDDHDDANDTTINTTNDNITNIDDSNKLHVNNNIISF